MGQDVAAPHGAAGIETGANVPNCPDDASPRRTPVFCWLVCLCGHIGCINTFADIAKTLNRSTVYLSGLRSRFELPVLDGVGYSAAYLAFFRTVVHLRTLSIGEEALRDLWQIEKKLLQLLHADSTGSPTWFLDACAATSRPDQRLLLTNFDMGAAIHGQEVQPGLNFSPPFSELFAGHEMGEDVLRVVADYRRHHARILEAVSAELPIVQCAAAWVRDRLQAKRSRSRR